ncbi:MAG: response regulator transcription factor [Chloroflexota bacterium]
MTTIILADDHNVVRQGLRALLDMEPDFSIIGEAADGLVAVEMVERLRPDVLVVDLMLPGLGGLEVTREVGRRSPQTQVVILTMYAEESYVWEALSHGAKGYVLKDASATELIRAVRAATAGHRYLSPPFSDRAIEAYAQRAKDTALDPYDTLTSREREVLHLVAESYSNADIAERLSISPRTVETHRANLTRKLDLQSHTDLIRYALRRGIIPLGE